jgi:hypothetical protein
LFSPTPTPREEKAGVRRLRFFSLNPLTPSLSQFGGERE